MKKVEVVIKIDEKLYWQAAEMAVDKEAAEVVKRIFNLAIEGKGARTIANILSDDHILNPAAYAERKHPEEHKVVKYTDPYMWNPQTIRWILDSRDYLGHTILGKYRTTKLKGRRVYKNKPEDLYIHENTHEAIIDQETFDLAQKNLKRGPKMEGKYGKKQTEKYCGFLLCGDCGSRLTFHSRKVTRKSDGSTYMVCGFNCGSYRSIRKNCTSHYISEDAIESIMQVTLRALSDQLISNKEEFTEKLNSIVLKSKRDEKNQDAITLKEKEKRKSEIDCLIKKIYEDNIRGAIPDSILELSI